MSEDNKYMKKVNVDEIDVYKVCRLFEIKDHTIFHAIKKLLRLGKGHKSKRKDVSEAIWSLERWLELENEKSLNRQSEEIDPETLNRVEKALLNDNLEELLDRLSEEVNNERLSIADTAFNIVRTLSASEKNAVGSAIHSIWGDRANYPDTPLSSLSEESLRDWIYGLDTEIMDHIIQEAKKVESQFKARKEEDGAGSNIDQHLILKLNSLDRKDYQRFIYLTDQVKDLPSISSIVNDQKHRIDEWVNYLSENQRNRALSLINITENFCPIIPYDGEFRDVIKEEINRCGTEAVWDVLEEETRQIFYEELEDLEENSRDFLIYEHGRDIWDINYAANRISIDEIRNLLKYTDGWRDNVLEAATEKKMLTLAGTTVFHTLDSVFEEMESRYEDIETPQAQGISPERFKEFIQELNENQRISLYVYLKNTQLFTEDVD